MNLADFHTLVSEAIGRSTAYDSQIPGYVRRAARFIERNYTLQYMNVYSTFELDAEATEPRLIQLPAGIKRDRLIRILGQDKSYNDLRKVDPADVKTLRTERPSAYWLSGDDKIWLAQAPDQDYACEIYWTRFTTWPTLPDGTTWLLQNADDVLLAQTMVLMAPHLKDPDLVTMWSQNLLNCLKTLLDSDLALEDSNKPAVMGYGTTDP